MDYPINTPTAPGEYTSAALEEQNGTLTVRTDGTAITSSVIRDTTYSHPILNLPSWAELFGPFRELTGDDDPEPPAPEANTEPDPAAAEAAKGAPDDETTTTHDAAEEAAA
ncbi:hypothetical protein SEA_GRETCHEN_34 [Microbacterium phage Gretchen]|nr:hypothetical protein SEA_GRETCHEN_34 [Microbacterium phage Gretchen]